MVTKVPENRPGMANPSTGEKLFQTLDPVGARVHSCYKAQKSRQGFHRGRTSTIWVGAGLSVLQ
jgi:hypothetical protein